MKNTTETISALSLLLHDAYGMEGVLTRLGGENINFRVDTPTGDRYALKVVRVLSSEDAELERAAAVLVSDAPIGLTVPRLMPNRSGEAVTQLEHEGEVVSARLFTWLDGTAWMDLGKPTPDMLASLGRKLAAVDLVLAGEEVPGARRTHDWDLTKAGQHRSKTILVPEASRRSLLESAFHLWAVACTERVNRLPWGLIHGDANDENLLIATPDTGEITGLLDFGDCLYNPIVCDLAIALEYAMFRTEHPLDAGAFVVTAYHGVRPLALAELEVLFPFVVGRLCVSVTVAAERRRVDPEHPNWFDTEERSWGLLERLMNSNLVDAGNRLASGTGLVPFPPDGATVGELLPQEEAGAAEIEP